ncbi:helix-turn-helix transcriptional regulator [Nocardiopsis akebiae]|uniref:Helix-turn-helix transcriptional regulator n=2 Tax=Nocardiopsis akebiae TaxID=2831968 RepID=A0ABX8C4Q7_9ACTN|nr:helix-turn-helix transcriptional regulator [Nocardiopsis akebiae]
MGTSLHDMLAKRPVDREAVEVHKRRMLDEVRAYHRRELRELSELTQDQLAGRLNISQNTVSSIERGDIGRSQVETLRRYVEALGGELRVEVEIGAQRCRVA